MAEVTIYNTTNSIIDYVLDTYSNHNLDYTVADVITRSIVQLATYSSNMATEYQSGSYDTGFATDGSFVIETPSYISYYYGSISFVGSTINHLINIEKITGTQTEVFGSLKYDGLPAVSESLTSNVSQITTTYKLSGNWGAQDSFYLNSYNETADGTATGNIYQVIGVMTNNATNEMWGTRMDGSIPFSTNQFNPNLTEIGDGNISAQVDMIYDFDTGHITDSNEITGLTWPLNTPLKDLRLNTGDDSYHLTGTLGTGINGGDGNDYFYPSIGNDSIDGGNGTDTTIFPSTLSSNSINKTINGYTVTGTDQIDELINIERVHFTDKKLAFDLTGNAGITAKVLGAVFGKDSVSNEEYVGIGLNLLDNGMSYGDLMKLAIDARLGANASHSDVVDLLYTNVVGESPSAEVLASFVGQLDSGVYTVASLGMLAADTTLNADNINLVGISVTGLQFI